MAGEMEVVAGDLPLGSAAYVDGMFRFRKKIELGIEQVIGIQRQGVRHERSFTGTVKDAVGLATTLGPVGFVLGVAFAPAAIPVGIGAAAIGAALGLLGGGQTTKAVLYVGFRDGRTATALCEEALIDTIGNDSRTIQALAERHRQVSRPRPAESTMAKWRYAARPSISPPVANLPTVAPVLPAATLKPEVEDPGFVDHAGRAVSAAADAAVSAATSVGDAVGSVLGLFNRKKE